LLYGVSALLRVSNRAAAVYGIVLYLPGTTNDYLPCHTVVAVRAHYAGYTSPSAAMCACDQYQDSAADDGDGNGDGL